MDFSSLGLTAPVVGSVERQNFTHPTDIQEAAIPSLLEGRDLMGVAQTGGGKTAAFLLPLIEKILAEGEPAQEAMPRAIILAPTRELAQQIAQATRLFAAGLKVYSTVIYGGSPYRQQLQDLRRGVHIVIATPGRLMDHVKRKSIYFDNAHTFILDEADRMLDMGFIDDVKDISRQLSAGHQTVMFSATMNKGIRNLASTLLKDPVHVEITPQSTVADTIDHRILCVNHREKKDLLKHIIDNEENMGRTLIFTRTKAMADKISKEMKGARLKADSIHGDRPQAVRERILSNFKGHKIQYLVATDVAARGIDVQDITHVINYDMPLEAESYVHRVGRTGRAGNKGIALSLCATDEGELLYQVEKAIGHAIEVDDDHPFHAEIQAPVRQKKQRGRGGRGGRPSGGGRGRSGGGFDRNSERGGTFGRSSGPRNDNRSEGRPSNRPDSRSEGRPNNRSDNRSEGRNDTRNDNTSRPARSTDRPSDKYKSDKRDGDSRGSSKWSSDKKRSPNRDGGSKWSSEKKEQKSSWSPDRATKSDRPTKQSVPAQGEASVTRTFDKTRKSFDAPSKAKRPETDKPQFSENKSEKKPEKKSGKTKKALQKGKAKKAAKVAAKSAGKSSTGGTATYKGPKNT